MNPENTEIRKTGSYLLPWETRYLLGRSTSKLKTQKSPHAMWSHMNMAFVPVTRKSLSCPFPDIPRESAHICKLRFLFGFSMLQLIGYFIRRSHQISCTKFYSSHFQFYSLSSIFSKGLCALEGFRFILKQ